MTEKQTALYLISFNADAPTKIGISHRPQKRLGELQGGQAKRLSIFGLYWFRSRDVAEQAERWLLRDHLRNKRLEGEWVAATARQLSPILAGLITIKFGSDALSEWMDCFSEHVNPVDFPELWKNDGIESAHLGFGS